LSELLTRVAKLVPNKRSKALPGYTTAFAYDPPADTNTALGKLLIVIEVLAASKQAEEVVDLVIQCMGDSYYNSPGSDYPGADTALKRFEAAIKTTNQELAHYTESGHASWVGKMSAIISVQVEADVHLSYAGSAEAYLYRGPHESQITAGKPTNEPYRANKTFSTIISGELAAGDKILLATPAIFHLIAGTELAQIMKDNSSNGAVHKFGELLVDQPQADRVAALVVELLTPEQAALQVLPDESAEVNVGKKAQPLDGAKTIAAPLAARTLHLAKRGGNGAVAVTKNTVIPRAKAWSLSAVRWLRKALGDKKQRRIILVLAIVVVLAGGWFIRTSLAASSLSKLQTNYQATYALVQKADEQASSGDKAGAQLTLVKAQEQASSLAKDPGLKKLDNKLSHTKHPAADPASVSGLIALINTNLDTLQSLVKVTPTKVADFTTIKDAQPKLLTLVGSRAISFDNHTAASYTYDVSTKQMKVGASNKSLGDVVAVTAGSNNEGVYLLTSKPSVWLYKPEDDSYTEQTLGIGDWPKGKSIATYSNNIYILADDSSQIYKFGKTLTGFTGKTNYLLSASDISSLAGATAIAVDGSIYAGGVKDGVNRYLAGSFKTSTTDLPSSLMHDRTIHSITDGSALLMVDASSSRLGLLVVTDSAITFKRQYQVMGVNQVMDSATDPKTNVTYVLGDSKLWQVTLR
jgi:hypothetical protein